MNVVLPVASVQCDSVHTRNKVILLTSEQVLKINIGEHFEDDTAPLWMLGSSTRRLHHQSEKSLTVQMK